jgi:hypothetical protein
MDKSTFILATLGKLTSDYLKVRTQRPISAPRASDPVDDEIRLGRDLHPQRPRPKRDPDVYLGRLVRF